MHYANKPKGTPNSSWKRFLIILALITFTAKLFTEVQLDGTYRNERYNSTNDTAQHHLDGTKTVQDIRFSLKLQFWSDIETSGKKDK